MMVYFQCNSAIMLKRWESKRDVVNHMRFTRQRSFCGFGIMKDGSMFPWSYWMKYRFVSETENSREPRILDELLPRRGRRDRSGVSINTHQFVRWKPWGKQTYKITYHQIFWNLGGWHSLALVEKEGLIPHGGDRYSQRRSTLPAAALNRHHDALTAH